MWRKNRSPTFNDDVTSWQARKSKEKLDLASRCQVYPSMSPLSPEPKIENTLSLAAYMTNILVFARQNLHSISASAPKLGTGFGISTKTS